MAKRRKKKRRKPSPPDTSSGAETASAPKAPTLEPARPRLVAYGLIAVAAVLAFARGVPFELLDGWDDDRFILNDPLVREVSLAHLSRILSEPHFQAYHPLHLLSYWLDVPWVGVENGFAIHATSLVLWILALFAVFEASRALRLGFLGALAATLIVGLHPIQVEAVTWATGRKDILALGFSALAVLAHLRSERVYDGWRLASLLAFGAAGLSKTTALPLPLVLVAADVLLFRRSWRRALVSQVPLLLVAAALGAFTISIWSDSEMIRGQELDASGRISIVAASLTHHLATAAFPSRTSPLYPIARGESFGVALLFGGAACVLGAVFVAARRWKNPHLRFGLVAFALLWLPVSNAIPLYFQWQDRYLSLPLWPLAVVAGALLDLLASRAATPRWLPHAALGIVALCLGARTAQYVGVWRDATTLFGHAVSVEPESFYAALNLGHARARTGEFEGALSAYDRAIEVENLAVAHGARFRTVALIDERDQSLPRTQADELAARFQANVTNPNGLRTLAGDMVDDGYRRAVMLALDYSFRQAPISDEQLERAAGIQLEYGEAWLADYYLSRMSRPPITPALLERVQ